MILAVVAEPTVILVVVTGVVGRIGAKGTGAGVAETGTGA